MTIPHGLGARLQLGIHDPLPRLSPLAYLRCVNPQSDHQAIQHVGRHQRTSGQIVRQTALRYAAGHLEILQRKTYLATVASGVDT